ncbi:HAMP domain-containing sensor histidine kinase [Pedobacter sp. BMA]|uniref:sensor histidine kinase n=1 Tax=Pedobacter sp. BMA TaxID=1663685 RepID=UPI00064982A1|nr:HAMP domain-containing sensor histidine kinase [Pedobacter sp. BMA]KLT63633.1 histidine kinase [Pedobacter sp. BMA]
MKIKDRIALYFTLITTSMLLAVLCVIYFTFMKFLQADFFERLTDRTMVTAKLYLEADEISRDALNTARHKYLQKLTGEVTRIYDYKNRATFIGDTTQYWTKATIEKVRKNGNLKYVDGQRQVVGIYYKDNQGDFVILASADDQGSHNRLSKLLKIMIFVFILISAIVLVLSRWIAEKMLKPLKNLTNEVKQIDASNMEMRLGKSTNKDEINLIAESFNHLMDELEQAFILQKSFVANASHELRTPVTRLMMTAELALSKDREINAYREVLSSVLEDAEKMEHMINGLLALAKMDLELIKSQTSPISLSEVLKKTQQEWQTDKGHPFELNIILTHDEGAYISANEILLQIALDNIISNAFKFSNGRQVVCSLRENNQHIQITITDQGIGIPKAEKDEIFKAFYTRAEKAGLKGEGMGLYMTKKIIELFHGNIEISDNKDTGSTFTLKFPKL